MQHFGQCDGCLNSSTRCLKDTKPQHNIMNLLNIPNYPQQILQGVIIVIAVLIQGIQISRSR